MFSNRSDIDDQWYTTSWYTLSQTDSPLNYFSKRETFKQEKRLTKKTKFDYKCEICGDISSGYHYGAYTCEACKLFFSRTTKNKRKRKFEQCLMKNCDINVNTRSDCSECRFKKCLFKGMSLSKSKFGRNVVFKNEPKPVDQVNQSGKLVQLFYQIGQELLAIVYNSDEKSIHQNDQFLRVNLNYLLEKSIELIESKNKTDDYKFLKNYRNFNFKILNDRILDAFVLLFFCLFAVDFHQILAYQNNSQIFKIYYDNRTIYDLYLEKINTIVSNLSHSSAYLVKILLFLRIFNSLQSLDHLEATNKIDYLIKEMIKNEFILNKFISNEFSTVKPSFLDNSYVLQIIFVSTQLAIFLNSF